jgi:hypothetical protein
MSERIVHALPWVFAASLVLACLVASPKKELWVDECYALQLATDPDTGHMLTAVGSAVDGGLPPYYLLAHAWVTIFGPAVLGLRLLSALLLAAGVGLLWRPLTQAYTAQAAALAVAAGVLGAPLVREQSAEIRFYGLYFLAATAVVAAHARLSRRPSTGSLAATVAAHAVLVAAHPYGILYSAAGILALAIGDRLAGRTWPPRALIPLLAWTILLPLAPVILGIVDLARPHNWPPIPTLATFTAGCIALLSGGLFLAGGAAAAASVLARHRRLPRPPAGGPLLGDRPTAGCGQRRSLRPLDVRRPVFPAERDRGDDHPRLARVLAPARGNRGRRVAGQLAGRRGDPGRRARRGRRDLDATAELS